MGATEPASAAEIACSRCGYDLRAHGPDEVCPECGMSVGHSRRVAAFPRRPAWRNSDPRWRRRMVAGAWVLMLMPLADLLQFTGWAEMIRVPALFELNAFSRLLSESLLCDVMFFPRLMFFIGMLLIFSEERYRQKRKRDSTRRWGQICTCVTSVLAASQFLFLTALILTGIGTLSNSMPPQFDRPVMRLCLRVGSAWLRYGPQPQPIATFVQVVFASIVVLLATQPLIDALRAIGGKGVAVTLIAPLASAALVQPILTFFRFTNYPRYFQPAFLVPENMPFYGVGMPQSVATFVELAKWLIVTLIALRFTVAEISAIAVSHRRDWKKSADFVTRPVVTPARTETQ